MGTPTDQHLATIRTTGRGTDHYGPCEICGQTCSETHVHTHARVWQRQDGLLYLSRGPGMYGHRNCLVEARGQATDEATLRRVGNLLVAPSVQIA